VKFSAGDRVWIINHHARADGAVPAGWHRGVVLEVFTMRLVPPPPTQPYLVDVEGFPPPPSGPWLAFEHQLRPREGDDDRHSDMPASWLDVPFTPSRERIARPAEPAPSPTLRPA